MMIFNLAIFVTYLALFKVCHGQPFDTGLKDASRHVRRRMILCGVGGHLSPEQIQLALGHLVFFFFFFRQFDGHNGRIAATLRAECLQGVVEEFPTLGFGLSNDWIDLGRGAFWLRRGQRLVVAVWMRLCGRGRRRRCCWRRPGRF